MWLVMGVIGAIVDSVFITSFYKAKYGVKKYPLLIFTLSTFAILNYYLPQTVISKGVFIIIYCALPCFWNKTKKISYFILPTLLLGLYSYVIRQGFENDNLFWLFVVCSELICIIAISEDTKYEFKFNLISITFKMLGLVALIAIFILSKYYYSLR